MRLHSLICAAVRIGFRLTFLTYVILVLSCSKHFFSFMQFIFFSMRILHSLYAIQKLSKCMKVNVGQHIEIDYTGVGLDWFYCTKVCRDRDSNTKPSACQANALTDCDRDGYHVMLQILNLLDGCEYKIYNMTTVVKL